MEGPNPLPELRQIFLGELEDQLSLLERQGATLSAADAGPDERRAALVEIHRAVHSLKGASHAVAYGSLERLCHVIEVRLGPVRHGVSMAVRSVAEDVEVAARALRACLRSLSVGGALDEAAIADARREIERSDPGDRPPSDAREGEEHPALPAPREKGRAADTLRVPVARLDDVLFAAESLGVLAGGGGGREARFDRLDDTLLTLAGDLGKARELLRIRARVLASRDDDEALRLLERVLAAAHSVAGWARDQRSDEERAWRVVAATAGRLRTESRGLRVVSFASLAPGLDQCALSASRSLDRPVRLVMSGEDVGIDRRVRDGLREPLVHLVRNAIDHGIEPPDEREACGKAAVGRVDVHVAVTGHDARIVVSDDGRGVDLDALRRTAEAEGRRPGEDLRALLALLFEPGFTTRGKPSPLSGRGMGLDVVRQKIGQMHGTVSVETEPGRGTRFLLTVPLDLSVTHALVVRVRDVCAALVLTAVERLARVAPEDTLSMEGRLYLRDPAGPIPLTDLDAVLGLTHRPRRLLRGDHRAPCVVVAAGERRAAFRVDELLPQREVIVRPLGSRVRRAALLSGGAILEAGEVALVLDPSALVAAAHPSAQAVAEPIPSSRRVLVVDDSITTRQLEKTILEGAGYEVVLAHDGQHAWEILLTEPVDLVVSDIEMPRMDGFQLVARIRAASRTARLPIVLVTAIESDADRRRALDLGVDAYLAKRTFDQEALLDALERLR